MSYKKLLCGMLIVLGALSAPVAAQRVNPQSNTERGGVDVRQVAGRKVGHIQREATSFSWSSTRTLSRTSTYSTSTGAPSGSHRRTGVSVRRI